MNIMCYIAKLTYNILCLGDDFRCIQQEKGRFKESVMINDACGQLGLYETVHISGLGRRYTK